MSEQLPNGPVAVGAPPIDLPNAEWIHWNFCLAREAAKRIRGAALAAEGAAVLLALWRLVRGHGSDWLPFLILVFTITDVILRAYVEHLRLFGQHCRRLSLRSYASIADVPGTGRARVLLDRPAGLDVLGRGGPCHPLGVYYNGLATSGDGRLCELYANSAFFSWRLLRLYGCFLLAFLILLAGASTIILYRLAIDEAYTRGARETVVEALCSVVLVYVAVRVLETMVRAFYVASRFRSVFDALRRLPRGEELQDLADEYDLERASGFESPTTLYLLFDRPLSRKWDSLWPQVVRDTKVEAATAP